MDGPDDIPGILGFGVALPGMHVFGVVPRLLEDAPEETPHEVKPTPGRQPSKTWKTKSKSKAARKKTIKIPEVAAEDMDGGTTPGFQVESFIPKQKDIDGFFESSK